MKQYDIKSWGKEEDESLVSLIRRDIIRFIIRLCPNLSLEDIGLLLGWIQTDISKIENDEKAKIKEEVSKIFQQKYKKVKGGIILNLFDNQEKILK